MFTNGQYDTRNREIVVKNEGLIREGVARSSREEYLLASHAADCQLMPI